MKKKRSYNIQIWISLREKYSFETHSLEELKEVCDAWVREIGQAVSVTETEFVHPRGREKGAVIGFIQYPRFPKPRKRLRTEAFDLANRLMRFFNQYRVSVVTPKKTYMLTNDRID